MACMELRAGYRRFVLAGAAGSLLAGCRGSQLPAVNPPPQTFSLPSTAKLTANADNASYLYVADDAAGRKDPGGEVDILRGDDPAKGIVDRIITGVSQPDGIFVDAHGTLYVTTGFESGNRSVEAYKKGAHKPFRTYVGASCAFDVIAADDGTVYIADACSGSGTDGRVLVYPPGRSKPSRSIYPGGPPYCLALDAQNNLYVGYNADYTYWGQVQRFRPGARRGVDLIPPNTVFFLTDIAIDSHGALLVSNGNAGAIDVFTQKDQPPSRVIKTGQADPFKFAFDQDEKNIYVTYPCLGSGGGSELTYSGCGTRANTLVALDYASGKRLWTVHQKTASHDGWLPFGVAVYPKAPFGNGFSVQNATAYEKLYNFKGIPDGASPNGHLVDSNGLFYGSTYYGGASGAGAVFRMTASGEERVVHSFQSVKHESANPLGIAMLHGVIYGTTPGGGANDEGTVFTVTPAGKERTLYSFGHTGDAREPYSGLLPSNGTFYGEAGGGTYGLGSVYSITPAGEERVICSLPSSVGPPTGGLIAVNGILYGTSPNGGSDSDGTVFSLTTAGSVHVLHNFTGGSDGSSPNGGVTALHGVFYGTTMSGGAYNSGTVFSLSESGNEQVLHDFGSGTDGASPLGALAVRNGVLYGTTEAGGTYGKGTLFSITTAGTESVLHSFGRGSDGAEPVGNLFLLKGTFYGTTVFGGSVCNGAGCGTVFDLTP
ncbi:MAG TPA: choice-of-anchor tandem repeat GloVer-containing protein [Candidatus Cybelea sp.]|nr:choice-of-anchor tandem repeat GloVer-containing protein [Candidatus Cybelea sp.]